MSVLVPQSRVWVKDSSGQWKEATVLVVSDSSATVRLDATDSEFVVATSACCNQNTEHDVEDMTRLSFLHEPGVLWNLQSRYARSNIYTYTGSILIAVNPFAPLRHLYGPDVLHQYHGCQQLGEAPPHVFAIACAAHRQMMRDGQGQAILVTGESGAGKTETSKLVMQCLTRLGAQAAGGGENGGVGQAEDDIRGGSIHEKVLESNPILEAFGNAKTMRNDNSSRFGKYVELRFSDRGALVGAAVRTYLLERSRVVHVTPGERSFHAFYQLCGGASASDRQRWHLGSGAASFKYLNQGNASTAACLQLPGVSDTDEYQHTRVAMGHVGLKAEVQDAVFGLLAGILHLGNIEFQDHDQVEPSASSNGQAAQYHQAVADGCRVLPGAAHSHLAHAAALLGVPTGALEATLTTRQRMTLEGTLVSPLSAQAAEGNRDALARTLYARLFDWLVAQINVAVAGDAAGDAAGEGVAPAGRDAVSGGPSDGAAAAAGLSNGGTDTRGNGVACSGLRPGNSGRSSGDEAEGQQAAAGVPTPPSSTPAGRRIGLLDIYGFESFALNDLEQLCINLANEKLQQHFNTHVFKWEQAEYIREGIDWSLIEFEDNQDVVDLVEGKLGLLDLLDEQCRFPTASAEDLSVKLLGSSVLQASRRYTALKRPANAFAIDHYAGSVTYVPTNFLDKNRDYVVADHYSLMGASSQPLVQALFAEPQLADAEGGAVSGAGAGRSGVRSAYRFHSVSAQFRRQLEGLMAQLESLQPHYVRCIKPNAASQPGCFDPAYVLQQLKCGGVMEAVRISCAGFAYKREYAAFLEYFRPLAPSVVHRALSGAAASTSGRSATQSQHSTPGQSPHAVCVVSAAVQLMQAAGLDQYQQGHTKVFLRSTQVAFLESRRNEACTAAATRIQASWRGLRDRRWYCAARRAAVVVQAHVRSHLARVLVDGLRVEHAALRLQSLWRMASARLLAARMVSSATVLQAMWRGLVVRREVQRLARERAAVRLQCLWRARTVRHAFLAAVAGHRAATRIQRRWRGWHARRTFLRLLPQHRAALVIQRCWRQCRSGTRKRQVLRNAFLMAWLRHQAALLIQAAWRGKAARLLLGRLRHKQRLEKFRKHIEVFNSAACQAGSSCQAGFTGGVGKSLGTRAGGSSTTSPNKAVQPVPQPSGEVVRSDAVEPLKHRLGAAGEFKLSPLLDFWKSKMGPVDMAVEVHVQAHIRAADADPWAGACSNGQGDDPRGHRRWSLNSSAEA